MEIQDFLDGQERFLKENCPAIAVFDRYEEQKEKVHKDLAERLAELAQKYQELENQKLVQSPHYLQISFLHTGILDCSSFCRLDLYDERWVTCPVECGVQWNLNFVFQPLPDLSVRLHDHFLKQSKVKEYEIDKLVMECAEDLFSAFLQRLPNLLKIFSQTGAVPTLYADNKVKVFAGEYLDQSYPVYDWGKT